jgi:hypothetical protein
MQIEDFLLPKSPTGQTDKPLEIVFAIKENTTAAGNDITGTAVKRFNSRSAWLDKAKLDCRAVGEKYVP